MAKGSVRGLSLTVKYPNSQTIPVGVVMRRTPGVTKWVPFSWRAVAVLPGAADASWKLMQEEGEAAEFHAATRNVTLYVSDTEAYVHELGARVPSVYVILRQATDQTDGPFEVLEVTASPYEAQDYADSGEELVERVAMPPALLNWVISFVETYHVEEEFVKRKRNKSRTDMREDGVGDARISQATDVYRAPGSARREAAE